MNTRMDFRMKRNQGDKFHPDSLDAALIAALQIDGRLSFTELGTKIGVSHATIRNRLERLLAHEVIRTVAVIDPIKVGFPVQVLIGIRADLNAMSEIGERLSDLEEVFFVAATTGRFDFFIFAALSSDEHLRDFLTRKLARIRGLRDTETFHVLSMTKRIWDWRPRIARVEARRSAKPASARSKR